MSKTVKLNDGKMGVDTSGRFQLKVNTDSKKFRMTNINGFVPYGRKIEDKLNFMSEAGEVEHFLIDKIKTTLFPDEKSVDEWNVRVLIQHPDVRIDGIPDSEWDILVKKNLKKSRCKFSLVNLDKIQNEAFDNEAELIEAKYLLYNKKNPITKERLLWLCTRFNLATRTHIQDEEQQRKFYIKLLERFVEVTDVRQMFDTKKSNIETFVDALDRIKETEFLFYIENLIDIGIIVDYSGVFKVGDRPIGSTKKHIIDFYEANQDVYREHKKVVLESIRNQEIA